VTTLHGVAIGADRDEVVGKLHLGSKVAGNPWKNGQAKEHLGLILKADDLNLKPADLDELLTMRTSDGSLAVLFHEDRVVAVVSRQRSDRTDRGVAVGDGLSKLSRVYDDQRMDYKDVDVPGGGHVKLHVYRALGVGFEVTTDRVTGITLFPAK